MWKEELLMRQKVGVIRICIFLIFCFSVTGLAGQVKLPLIEDPKPTMEEKSYRELTKVKKIQLDFGDDKTIYQPFSLVVDKEFNVYIYDRIQAKVFVLDKDFKYVRSFGKQGRGPGEFYGNRAGVVLSIGNDGNLYANDQRGRQVNVFNREGQYIKTFRIQRTYHAPVLVYRNGHCLAVKYEDDGQIIFHNLDGKKLFTLPFVEEDRAFLFQTPIRPSTSWDSCWMSLSSKGQLFFLIRQSATLTIIENGKAIKKSRIWGRALLKDYEYRQAQTLARLKNANNPWVDPFWRMFMDQDNENSIYILRVDATTLKQQTVMLYQIGLEGDLLNVLYTPAPLFQYISQFHAKAQGYFYALDDENLYLYKD